MTDFYADPALGGDGSHTTDDNDPSTGLGNGGFWTRLVPMFKNVVAIGNYIKGAATNAANSATAAAASAATAINAPGTSATCATLSTIGLGLRNVNLGQVGKLFSVGQTVVFAVTADPSTWMAGTITAFNSATGAMSVNVTNYVGSGSYSAWTVSLSGPSAGTGVINEMRGTDVSVSAAGVLDLTAVTGNYVNLVGGASGTISDILIPKGASRTVFVATGAGGVVLQHSATHNVYTPGQANITLAVWDVFEVRGDGLNIAVITSYTRASGRAVKENYGLVCLSVVDFASSTASIDFSMDGSYDEYVLEVVSLLAAGSTNVPALYFSTDGGATFLSSSVASTSVDFPATNQSTVNQSAGATNAPLVATFSTPAPGAGAAGWAGQVRFYNPASSTKRKTVTWQGCNDFANGQAPVPSIGNAVLTTTTPINRVRLNGSGGAFASGSLRFYGVRKALT